MPGQFRAVWHPRDYDAAVAFYRDTLGFEQVGGWDRSPDDKGILLAAASGIIELLQLPEAATYVEPAGIGLYIEVDDVDMLHARLGGLSMLRPQDTSWGHRQLLVTDPDGVPVTFFSPIG
jgi:catechol 2,3-dioxygenase-like lactoylglutathione lyase family enzyme